MALGACLPDLLARNAISQATHDRLKPTYDELVAQLEPRYGRAAAESMATERVLDGMELDLAHRKRKALLQARAQDAWLKRRREDALPSGAFDAPRAHDDMVATDYHRQAIRKQAFGMIDGLLAKHRRNLLGEVRAKSDLDAVVDELHGRSTGDVNARELADAWTRTAEWLRGRFNAAGGRIAKLDTWALPQRHDGRTIREAGFEAWREFLVPLLDRGKMIDYATGAAMSDGKLELLLRDMWEAIATEGWSRATPGGMFRGAAANAMQEHRVLHFDGPDAWRAYADRFGGAGTAFDAMMGHVERMAREIAAMERLGPNPEATVRWQGDWIVKSAFEAKDEFAIRGKASRLRAGAEGQKKQLERLWNEYSGGAHRPESEALALGFSAFRALQTAAKLGSAVLSVGGDFGTTLKTLRFNDLPAMKTMARYTSLMNPANREDRALAARLGMVSDEWASAVAGQWRYVGEEMSHEVTRRLAEGVLRASGLLLHTEAARMAFGLEALSAIVTARGRSFDNLDPGFRRMLQRHGIDEGKWDLLRATETRMERGTEWFFPEDIADGPGGQAMADDVLRMIARESDMAVPMPDLRTRALISRAPKGDLWGEIARSAFLFKGFPLSIINLHGRRMLEQPGAGARWKYGLTLVALTGAGGVASLQLKELAKGRDPQDMTSARFLAAAVLQGGGLGIFGDLIGSSADRFGGGLGRTLLGPAAQTADNFGRLVFGNARAALDGDPETETSVRRDLVRAVEPEVPGLSLWYTRLAYERLLGDLIEEWANPNAAQSYRRAQQYAEEQGTAYWAPPGSVTGAGEPMRAPNLRNALGGGEEAME